MNSTPWRKNRRSKPSTAPCSAARPASVWSASVGLECALRSANGPDFRAQQREVAGDRRAGLGGEVGEQGREDGQADRAADLAYERVEAGGVAEEMTRGPGQRDRGERDEQEREPAPVITSGKMRSVDDVSSEIWLSCQVRRQTARHRSRRERGLDPVVEPADDRRTHHHREGARIRTIPASVAV